MTKANCFIENTKGQLNAILGIMLAAAFLIVGIIMLHGMVNNAGISEGDTFYNALDYAKNNIVSSIVMATLLIGISIGTIFGVMVMVINIFRRVSE